MASDMAYRCPECKNVMLRTEACDPRYACICPFCAARDRYIQCDEYNPEEGDQGMNKYVMRAVADRDGNMETVDDKDAEMFGVYEILDDGTQEWVADFGKKRKAEAAAFCRLMERQGAAGGRRSMAKTPHDFDVKSMTVRHEDGKPAFPVVISMPSKEAGIAIENMGRSSLAMVAAYFYNLGREDGLEVMPIACADCGRDIRDEYDDGGRSGGAVTFLSSWEPILFSV